MKTPDQFLPPPRPADILDEPTHPSNASPTKDPTVNLFDTLQAARDRQAALRAADQHSYAAAQAQAATHSPFPTSKRQPGLRLAIVLAMLMLGLGAFWGLSQHLASKPGTPPQEAAPVALSEPPAAEEVEEVEDSEAPHPVSPATITVKMPHKPLATGGAQRRNEHTVVPRTELDPSDSEGDSMPVADWSSQHAPQSGEGAPPEAPGNGLISRMAREQGVDLNAPPQDGYDNEAEDPSMENDTTVVPAPLVPPSGEY